MRKAVGDWSKLFRLGPSLLHTSHMVNKMVRLLNVCLLFSAIVAAAFCQSFEGSYPDVRFGGTLYICVENGKLHGMYSEFGVLQGEVVSTFATGNFYEPGPQLRDCSEGTFELQLESASRGFRGFYTCDDSGQRNNWNVEKINVTTPSDIQCAKLADAPGEIEGNYNGFRPVSLCTDDDGDLFYSSYAYQAVVNGEDSVIRGREEGGLDREKTIARGVYTENQGFGVSMYMLLKNGELGITYYTYDNGEVEFENGQHAYGQLQYFDDADDEDCNVARLVDVNDNSFNTYPLSPSTSPAIPLLPYFSLLTTCLVVLLATLF